MNLLNKKTQIKNKEPTDCFLYCKSTHLRKDYTLNICLVFKNVLEIIYSSNQHLLNKSLF